MNLIELEIERIARVAPLRGSISVELRMTEKQVLAAIEEMTRHLSQTAWQALVQKVSEYA